MKKWARITNDADLRRATIEAPGNVFVGVTQSGKLYIIDSTNKAAEVSLAQAAEKLNVSHDTVAEIVRSRGAYEIPVEITPALVGLEEPKLAVVDAEEVKEAPKAEITPVSVNPDSRLKTLLKLRYELDEEIKTLINS
jgi:hypothetical protein